ncbi:MAG: primosomal protein N', partial [Clostridia bacterium]|nr:primosomal protein N' [Clostridia bacterium]
SNSEVDKIFDYLIPSDFELAVGDRVLVPFGSRSIEGFCIKITDYQEGNFKLKQIIKKLDDKPLIKSEMIALAEFMKEKFYLRFVDVLRLFIPSKLRGNKVKALKREYCTLANKDIDVLKSRVSPRAKSQLAIIDRLADGGEYLTVLNTEFSPSVINSLVEKGIVVKSKQEVLRKPLGETDKNAEKVELTSTQKDAIEQVNNSDKRIVLLHGVTGSGKTEVYMSLIENALKSGKTAIALVPEISLTPQILRVFRARFGDDIAMLHSGLSDGERYDEWRRIYDGDAKIVVGARSAIFAPLENLGIIIIDEEHDSSYISESNPRFRTLEVAEFRATYNDCKVVLGSATPSVETYNNARLKKIGLAEMNKRISKNGMPQIKIVDMAQELRTGNFSVFSAELKEKLQEVIKNGNQAMVFINRRGYASYMQCKSCGYIAKCTDCDIALTYHKEDNMLKCHYCGKRFKPLDICPSCHSESIKQGKIGTEKVVRELQSLLGDDVKILRMDNDTTNTKTAYLDILGAFRRGEAQVLVGTQMIVKGHDFPNVTLVGVLDADMSLYFSDYRACERTYQLITQVSGRAGRKDKLGEVIIQTYSPK